MSSPVVKVVAVVCLIFLGVFAFFYFANYSTGTRAGVVMKVSKKGVLIKTHEGMLDIGTINDPWEFSVASGDTKVLKQLEAAQSSGERVRLHYREKFAKFFWLGDTPYFVTQVDRITVPDVGTEESSLERGASVVQ